MDGSDHSGYAQVADWLRDHPAVIHPNETPEVPYETWPSIMFAQDARFGAFGFLAIIAFLHHGGAIFSFDFACAVALSAAIITLLFCFSASVLSRVLLAVGLFASSWLDYAHGGYLGKILNYPAVLFFQR
jgi:hypothetical protein